MDAADAAGRVLRGSENFGLEESRCDRWRRAWFELCRAVCWWLPVVPRAVCTHSAGASRDPTAGSRRCSDGDGRRRRREDERSRTLAHPPGAYSLCPLKLDSARARDWAGGGAGAAEASWGHRPPAREPASRWSASALGCNNTLLTLTVCAVSPRRRADAQLKRNSLPHPSRSALLFLHAPARCYPPALHQHSRPRCPS